MNNSWQTKADVLRDLGEVNGRRTGAEELDRHVVAGERPPPYHHEIPDKDEMSYFGGGHRASAAGDGAGPDLAGISTMLKMVNDMDETVSDNETMTLYRNRVTDEIRISKLNPYAGEYVPGVTTARAPRYSPNKSNNKQRTRNGMTVNENVGSSHFNKSVNETKQNGLPTFNNMFKSKGEKDDIINATAYKNTTKVTESEIRHKEVTTISPISKSMFKSKSGIDDKINATANGNTAKVTESEIKQKVVTPVTKPMFKSENEKYDKINPTVNGNTGKVTESEIKQKYVTPVTKPMFKSENEQYDKINPTVNGNTGKVTESEIKQKVVTPVTKPMFKSENEQYDKINPTVNGNTGKVTESEIKQKVVTPVTKPMFKSENEQYDKINPTVNGNTGIVMESEIKQKVVTPETKPNILPNGLPKRHIEKQDLPKADEIKEIQEKIKSTIIASSTDNSLKTKRQKNVAIATLLKLGTIPSEPVKLIKPDYFEKPPTNEEKVNDKVENLPSTSSSETNVNYIDQESISKVDSWFSSMECPKPKPQLQEKLVLKDSITFKKKTASSVTSRNTTTSKEDKESPKETKSFKPSAYANDLLKKYETNAQRQEPLIEDLGTRLERQLRERDELIKQKMLARQNAG